MADLHAMQDEDLEDTSSDAVRLRAAIHEAESQANQVKTEAEELVQAGQLQEASAAFALAHQWIQRASAVGAGKTNLYRIFAQTSTSMQCFHCAVHVHFCRVACD